MRDFRKLSVWKKSHLLTLSIYKITSIFPDSELYGLTNQMQRAAVSIASNIAEGCGRNTQPQFARFLNITFGSASELEYQIVLAKDLDFIDVSNFKELFQNITEIKRMLSALFNKVKADS